MESTDRYFKVENRSGAAEHDAWQGPLGSQYIAWHPAGHEIVQLACFSTVHFAAIDELTDAAMQKMVPRKTFIYSPSNKGNMKAITNTADRNTNLRSVDGA